MTSGPVVLVLAWEATDAELHRELPSLVLSTLNRHAHAFGTSRPLSLSIGLGDDAEAVQELTKHWKRSEHV